MKEEFTRFLQAGGDRLHAAAHSHHPWPDVTYEAHRRAWEDAARLWDDKWDDIFGQMVPAARAGVARILGLPDPSTLVFAPNTHEFVVRIASNLPRPFRVLTTDSEFHSFARQLLRWEEAGVAVATRIAARPYDTFPERFLAAQDDQELILFSHVHFNSGYVTPNLSEIVDRLDPAATVVIDGYHGFMALPTDLGSVASRAFYLAGGYKYAMAGEGACFLHVPATAPDRPVDTGWWAGFDALEGDRTEVVYGPGGQRYAGATADPSGLYRLNAVLAMLERRQMTVGTIHRHVRRLQGLLLELLHPALTATLVPPTVTDRGHFLTFERPDAAHLYRALHEDGVVTDHRGDRWRIGLGIYHDETDIERLAKLVNAHF
ncbi:MAG: aminotransferase class V-fold PLP-dependent enzyme [Acidimicrobiia bacterium]